MGNISCQNNRRVTIRGGIVFPDDIWLGKIGSGAQNFYWRKKNVKTKIKDAMIL
jgi:hypothetical protein